MQFGDGKKAHTSTTKAAAKASAKAVAPNKAKDKAPGMTGQPPPATGPAKFPIVGLGASAGGLEAFEQFLRAMPSDSGMALVLVQHLDPTHGSILGEILQRSTAMPVVEAQDQMQVAPNHVYVIPPNREMEIFHGVLQLSVPKADRGQRMPIDSFMRSLADDQGADAIGIVLSGTGSDGTLGLRAIAGAGGLCLAQDPTTAKFDGMPTSAVRSGYCASVLAVSAMPAALIDSEKRLSGLSGLSGPEAATGAISGHKRILMQLRSATGHDFSLYKQGTIGRRIHRRMAQHGIDDAAIYARYAHEHADEMKALFHDMLINVTSFFRDPEAFDLLERDTLPSLLAGKPQDYTLRVWVAGCSTGEEAYSVAILLSELKTTTQRDFRCEIYATDLDDAAIASARAGLYLPNIAQDVSAARLAQFFVAEETGYRVRKNIRDMVVFAVQSVIKDPPFTRLDLLSCRNLLIYLGSELQDKLLPVFHYALKPGGVLMLAPSEGIGRHTDLFETIDRKWHLFRAKLTSASLPPTLTGAIGWAGGRGALTNPTRAAPTKEARLAEITKRALLQSFAPAAVVTDPQGNILYIHGDTGKFLHPAPGTPSHNVLEMAREGLKSELRDALRIAVDEHQPTLNRLLNIRDGIAVQPLSLSVRLLSDPGAEQPLLLVSFQDIARPKTARASKKPPGNAPTLSTEARRIASLEAALEQARQSMQSLSDEQQTSSADLKSLNEELQSTNEELQSSNEELETSKEELQSVNEELTTVNTELQTKIEQLTLSQDDMNNLLENIRLGIVFLDQELTVRRFTREANKIYRLLASDVGRPLSDVRCELRDIDLLAHAREVLASGKAFEREAQASDGAWYLARLQPYWSVENSLDGVLLIFADVSEQVHAVATRNALEVSRAIVDMVHEPLLVLDAALIVMQVNRAFCSAFGGTPQDSVGKNIFKISGAQWDFAAMRELLETALPQDRRFEGREITQPLAEGGVRRLRLSVQRLVDPVGTSELVLLAIDAPQEAAP